ncbi:MULTISPECIES: DUF1292 domain-containing protein [Clostridium]|uniref:DUF1292 domain-containing protein n=1 Tax=Clostridium senegalense TaxID=1465809 RepID=A0A6M0H617_9CLOT|nr:DUF1292 domain-containing protein [Clostridium senegalense]MBU5227579.1 DUF1292 domain-containing protein [Clostridium senegalense]NEU06176.1 DUF1292 domain-containing protein [Clostridium senegalense]
MELKKRMKFIDPETKEVVELEEVDRIELNGNTYLLLAPLDNSDDAYIYKIVNMEGEKYELTEVEDEKEFEAVVAEYDRLFDEEMNE